MEPDVIAEIEQEVTRVLNAHPRVKREMTYLLNVYRSTLENCIEQMGEAYVDVADTQKDRNKIDARLRRIGIAVLETGSDWEHLHEWYRERTKERKL